MYRKVLLSLALLCFAHPLMAIGSSGWAQLKLGMMPGETVSALGAPLIRSVSRGFELWIYDGHAEVLFFSGPVVAWTAPAGSNIPNSPSVDLTSVRPPAKVSPVQKNAGPRNNNNSDGYDQLPVYRFRRRQ